MSTAKYGDFSIFLSPPDVTDLEKKAILEAFDSGYIAALGPVYDKFNERMAEYVGRKHAIALASGTAALHLGLIANGVGPGDIVLVSSLTFAASANAVVYTGATPVFVDSGDDGNIDPELLAEALETLTREGTPAKAIIPVDLLGKMCDPEPIVSLARQYSIPVVWDAAESVGATRAGRRAGSFGECAALSFNGNKIMTTSGGGMLLTDDDEMASLVLKLATQAREPVPHYEHEMVGYNYRLSSLLAGLGLAQLERLDGMMARRRALRERYTALFADQPGVEIFGGSWQHPDGEDNCWLTALVVDERSPWRAEELGAHLRGEGIETRPLWKPMHMQPVYANNRAFLNGKSERFFRLGIDLPSGSKMTDDDVARVENSIKDFLG